MENVTACCITKCQVATTIQETLNITAMSLYIPAIFGWRLWQKRGKRSTLVSITGNDFLLLRGRTSRDENEENISRPEEQASRTLCCRTQKYRSCSKCWKSSVSSLYFSMSLETVKTRLLRFHDLRGILRHEYIVNVRCLILWNMDLR